MSYSFARVRYIVQTVQAAQICGVIMLWSSYIGNLTFTFSTVSGCFSEEFSEFGDTPNFLDSAIYCHPEQHRDMGCFLERALAHLPGYLNGLTVGIHGEQRGRWGNKHETGLPLASPEGSFASRCHSRKLGKCLTLLSQGLIPTRRTGQIGQHSTHQKEV